MSPAKRIHYIDPDRDKRTVCNYDLRFDYSTTPNFSEVTCKSCLTSPKYQLLLKRAKAKETIENLCRPGTSKPATELQKPWNRKHWHRYVVNTVPLILLGHEQTENGPYCTADQSSVTCVECLAKLAKENEREMCKHGSISRDNCKCGCCAGFKCAMCEFVKQGGKPYEPPTTVQIPANFNVNPNNEWDRTTIVAICFVARVHEYPSGSTYRSELRFDEGEREIKVDLNSPLTPGKKYEITIEAVP